MTEPVITEREKAATRKLAKVLAEEQLNPVESLTAASLLLTAITYGIYELQHVPDAQRAALRVMERVFEHVALTVLTNKVAKEGGL
ncbi:MAG TPA: hypothetical protein VIK75_00355 [Calditerricola sp.]